MYFEDTIDEVKYCGHLFGLGSTVFPNGVPYESYMPSQNISLVNQAIVHSHNSASQSSLANLGANPVSNTSLINSHNSSNSASTPNLLAANINNADKSNIK